MNSIQSTTGTLVMGAILIFGIGGLIAHAQSGEVSIKVDDETYLEECGACHYAYPPALLPLASWNGVMDGLEDHFGEDATLDEAGTQYINDYLANGAARPGVPTAVSELLRNLPEPPPLRITHLPAFVDAHQQIAEQLDMTEFPDGFLSPCLDCHRQADQGEFSKERLHPGYGPSTWGGEPSD